MKLKRKNKKGFTLIELLVAVLVIGLLSAIAIPFYFKAMEKTRATEAISMLGSIARAEDRIKFASENQEYTDQLGVLDINPMVYSKQDASSFDTQYFDFTLKEDHAQAHRKPTSSEDYTLYIDYATAKLTCSNKNGSRMCARLGLDEETEFNQGQWEECSGTSVGDAWQRVFGGSIYPSDSSSTCQMKVNSNTGATEFDFCYDTPTRAVFFSAFQRSSSIDLTCAKGVIYEDERKGIISYCTTQDCALNSTGGYPRTFYYEREADDAIFNIQCDNFNYEEGTCNDPYRNIYYLKTSSKNAYCTAFDSENRCTACTGSGCSAISGKVMPL